MSKSKLGIDIFGDTLRASQIEVDGGDVKVTALHRFPLHEPMPTHFDPTSPVTIAVPDSQAIVRVVHTAVVEPSLAETAARYEAASALVSRASSVRTTVGRISLSGDVPRPADRWLATSVHATVLLDLAARALIDFPDAQATEFITRSIALGRGYLGVCESPADPSTVVIQPTVCSTAICFLCRGAIVGTACLRGIDVSKAHAEECARWISELQMIVQYRLGSDLMEFYADSVPPLVLAAGDETVNRFNALSPIVFTPASIREDLQVTSDDATPVTPDWLIPLGAAFN